MASSTGPMAFLPRSRMLCPPRTRIFTSGRMQTSLSESVDAITCLSSRDSRINLLGIWALLGRLTAGEAMNYPPEYASAARTHLQTGTARRFWISHAISKHGGDCLGGEKFWRGVARGQRKIGRPDGEGCPIPHRLYGFCGA